MIPAEPIGEASTAPPNVVTVIRRPGCLHGVSAIEKIRSLAQGLGLGVGIDEILVLNAGDAEEHPGGWLVGSSRCTLTRRSAQGAVVQSDAPVGALI